MGLPLPLFPRFTPEPPAAAASGLAALAEAAEPLAAPNTVSYAALAARSILNRCQSGRMPFEWTLNPYRGCEFACRYCYARYTHEFMELRRPEDFERRIFVKQDGAALLERDLVRVKPGERIALGTATDPYQPAESRYRATRALLEVFARHAGLRLGIVTKSGLIVRDIELLRAIAAANRLSVRITVTTVDAGLARALEPRAPRPDLRLKAVTALRRAGITVGVIAAPVLPGITDAPASLRALTTAAAAAGAQSLHASPLFLQPSAQAVFFPFVREKFPHLWTRYERAYARGAYLGAAYADSLAARMESLAAEFGLNRRAPDADRLPAPPAQRNLF